MGSEVVRRRCNQLMKDYYYQAFDIGGCNTCQDYLFLISVEIVLFSGSVLSMHQGTRRQLHPRHPATHVSEWEILIVKGGEGKGRNLPHSLVLP